MIRLTRLNRDLMILNSDLIEHIEATPDTVVTLTNGQKIMVAESPDEIVRRVIDFRKAVLSASPSVGGNGNSNAVENGEQHR